MNEYNKHCEKNEESIIAFKVFDQCKIQKCITQGPVISQEKCTCIIVEPNSEDNLGRAILPEKPIYLPEIVSKTKVINNSFETKKIEVFSIAPSNIKEGYWDVEILFTFIFKIQLLDQNMNILKILCCPDDCNSIKECTHIKNYIWGSVNYIEKLTLFGSEGNSPLIASDIILNNQPPSENLPHIFVESKAYFIDANIHNEEDICDGDIYDDPIIYVYITIGIFMIVKLFRLANILVESKGYSIPKQYCDNKLDDCELFGEIQFPDKAFSPPIK
jgi:hypothetical protein